MRNFLLFTSIFLLASIFGERTFATTQNDSIQNRINELNSIEDIDSLLNARMEIIKYVENSDFALFLELANRNLELAQKEKINWAQIDVYMELGESYVKMGNFGIALNYLNQGLKLAQVDEYQAYVGWITLAIGNAYEGMLNFKRAVEFYQHSLYVFDETDNEEGIALASTNIGNCYLALKDFANAKKYLEIGLNERIKLKNPIELGYVQMFLAQLNISLGEFFPARERLVEILNNLNDSVVKQDFEIQNVQAKVLMGDALCLLSECEDSLGFTSQKYERLFDAKKLFFELNDLLNLSRVYNLISRNFLLDGEYQKSINYADSAKQITEGGLMLNQQAISNKLLADIYFELKDYKKSLIFFKKYKSINDSMFNQSVTDAISNVDVYVGTITKEKDNQILKLSISQEKKIRTIVSVGFSLFVFLLIVLILHIFIRYRKGKKVNDELVVKNRQVVEQGQRLEELNNELQTLVKSKDKFHSIIAHDLRNPVGSIHSAIELLNTSYDDTPESTRRKLIFLLAENSKKTLDLLENLLAWSRVQGGHLKVKKTCFEITRVVDEIIENLRHIAEVKSNAVNFINNGEVEIFADREMISTVIRNLFSNAVKYSLEGKKITIGVQQKEQMVEIWVQDEGIGIPDEKIKELFLIDSEIQRPGTNNESGTGLGLQLSYEFVKLHNGYFEVSSKELKGSRFAFLIPIIKE